MALPTCGPPTRMKTSLSVVGSDALVVRHAAVPFLADRHEQRRVDRSGVDHEAGDDDAGDVTE